MVVNEVEDLLGQDDYARVCDTFGGTELFIPSRGSRAAQKLSSVIGSVAADLLIAWGSGSTIYVPRRVNSEFEQHRAKVLELRRRGKTISEIAREYVFESRFSERKIRQLLRGM